MIQISRQKSCDLILKESYSLSNETFKLLNNFLLRKFLPWIFKAVSTRKQIRRFSHHTIILETFQSQHHTMQVSQISAKTASPSTKISCLCTLSEIREINFVKTFRCLPKLLIFIHLPDDRTRRCSVLLKTSLLTLKVEIIGIKSGNKCVQCRYFRKI